MDDAREALGSIAIAIPLAMIAVVLAVEMKSLRIGEPAAPDVQHRIRAARPRAHYGRFEARSSSRRWRVTEL